MNKRRFIEIILLFIILTSLEAGIAIGVPRYLYWLGHEGLSIDLTTLGYIGVYFLICFMPVSAIVIFLIRLTLCIKKKISMKELVFDCICALFGIGIGIGILYLIPENPIFLFGEQVIDVIFFRIFDGLWIKYPIP